MTPDEMKRAAAEAAMGSIEPGAVIGIGSGTTVEYFIQAMALSGRTPRATVSSSRRTTALLESLGVPVVDLTDDVIPLSLYVDGADEADGTLRLIKGRGGALTGEKILATASERFVCIIDERKLSLVIGSVPLPVEVVPMARHAVTRELRRLGGEARMRPDYLTDNGNAVLDVTGLAYDDPVTLERAITVIPGVVECGLFAVRPADALIVGTAGGVRHFER